MKSFNPSAKFIGLLLPTLLIPLSRSVTLNASIWLISLTILLGSRVSFRSIIRANIAPLILAAGLFFSGYYFSNNQTLNCSNLPLLQQGSKYYTGLLLATRMLAVTGFGLLLILTTKPLDLVQSLHQNMHLPAVFAYGLLGAWGIMPQIAKEAKRTRDAFKARGLKVSIFSMGYLLNLLVKAIGWSDALSIAMVSKGFDPEMTRTYYTVYSLTFKDIVMITLPFCLTLLLIIYTIT